MRVPCSYLAVDERAVAELAQSLKCLPLAESFASTLAPRMDGPTEACLRACLWAASICHSTKGGLRGTFASEVYKGWDYLIRAFTSSCSMNPSSLDPARIEQITESELSHLLASAATDSCVTLVDLARRAEILRQTAHELLDLSGGSISLLLDRASHKVGGDTGAYKLLSGMTAFRDPLKKKSGAFLLTAHFGRLWIVSDQENLEPMIDYHRMRLLCRTGCIKFTDLELQRKLESKQRVAINVEENIRAAAADICRLLVRLTGLGMFECDNLLWAHARSCCRNQPVCTGSMPEDSSFYALIESRFLGRCEFQSWCAGFVDSDIRAIWEPTSSTENY